MDQHIEELQADGFLYVAELYDDGSKHEGWVHGPFFIRHYEAIGRNPEFYAAYRAIERQPKGRLPWTVNNKRIHPEDVRLATLEEAKALVGERLIEEAVAE